MPAIVDSGAAYIAAKTGASQPVQITDLVLAYIAGLDHTQPVNLAETLPDAGDIVHQAPVSQSGYLSPDKVVYSLAMDTSVGDFTFNWLGLKASDGTLVAVAYLPDTIKTASGGGVQGNNITRNFLMQFADAQLATGVSVPAETWQIDLSAYLNAMDARERLSNRDIYGAGAFFEGGWELLNNAGSYELQPGIGYVGGVRIVCTAPVEVEAGALPTAISLDVSLQKSGDQVVAEVTPVRGTPADYTDGSGAEHFVVQVADIDSGGVVIDQRLVFEAPNGLAKYLLDLIKSGTAHNHDAQYLGKDATAKDSEKVGGIESERIVSGVNGTGTTTIIDSENGWNSLSKSGFYDAGSSRPNGPDDGSSWHWGLHVEHRYGGYGWDMVSSNNKNPTWYLRGLAGGEFGSWHEVITSKGGQTLYDFLKIEHAGPILVFEETDASENNKRWNLKAGSERFVFQAINDAGGGGGGLFEMYRNGNNITNLVGKKSAQEVFNLDIWNKTLWLDGSISAVGSIVSDGDIELGKNNTSRLYGKRQNGSSLLLSHVSSADKAVFGSTTDPTTIQSSVPVQFSNGSATVDLLHSGGGQVVDTPILIKGTHDPDATGPSHLAQGLYVAELGTTQGASGNPTLTAAIIGSHSSSRQIALSVDVDGYQWGKRVHSNAGTYVWESKVKQADNAGTLGGQDSAFYRNASNLNAGQVSTTLIPNLSAGKITSGILGEGRIPDLDASKIATGILPLTRGGTGAATAADARSNLGLGILATLNSLSAEDVGAPPVDRTISASTGLSGGGSLASNRTLSLTNIAAGSSTKGALYYNGTTRSAGRLYGGSTNPSSSTRLNYDGYLNATRFYARSSRRAKHIERVDAPAEALRRVLAIGRKGFLSATTSRTRSIPTAVG
ncbi:phage tail protein [Microbulbifer taiwanensis]|uniref:phage tail-collar fiber domain-containing protein n=1 Tax=Microbulbifer taiwanensis TaxID=986746 RepID=UPI0036225340